MEEAAGSLAGICPGEDELDTHIWGKNKRSLSRVGKPRVQLTATTVDFVVVV